jgi:hypothetical protein
MNIKLNNYKTLPAMEANNFNPGDTIICYDSEVGADPEVVEAVDGDKLLLRNYDYYVDYRTCRKLVRREPYTYLVKVDQNGSPMAIFDSDYKACQDVGVEGYKKLIKVVEVLEG